ncbi:MAG: hypothetical protein D6B27_05315, partial [Gammaproteobacteria bacterium]
MDDVLKKLAIAASISSLTLISGCDLFDDDDTTSEDDPVTVTGDVVQGPVSGATVCADKHTTTYPIGNGICDSGERSTTTASDGSFDDLIIPDGYGEYTLISSGGVDTISGKAALPMRAPAGVDRITPVTTLVASISDSTEREALIEKLEEATGGDYDADPSDAAADADLVLLTKSVEQTLRAVDE